MTPLYIFSLPRSGSTLVQRVLSAHADVASAPEPWILLPFIYATKSEGALAEYWHYHATVAINEFIAALPNGQKGYDSALREFVMGLYEQHARGKHFFLDKTPRYHLVAGEICSTFGEAGKYISLWRNPLAVASSIIETWGNGRWNLYLYKIDLYKGLENLIDTYEKKRSSIYATTYEELILGGEDSWRKLFEYLGLEFSNEFLSKFDKVKLNGTMGDKTGIVKYSSLSTASLDGWKKSFMNPVRKAWARKYLKWIGRDRLQLMGYDLDELINELNAIPSKYSGMPTDAMRMAYGQVKCLLSPHLINNKLAKLYAHEEIYCEF